MIDLHLHTTASDGSSTPEQLVHEVRAAGITTMAVTDHDTTAAVTAVRRAAAPLGVDVVAGIEITSVHEGRDVHVLGYFLDPDDEALASFLREQRTDRLRRVVEIAARLDALGAPIDVTAAVEAARDSGRSVGRPHIAAALVQAGHAADVSDAFDRFLGVGRPGFVARRGGTPEDVVRRIADAGGVASLAHPGKTEIDPLIPTLVAAGLAAVEVFHPDHSFEDVARYGSLVADLGVVATGGSDYHGPGGARSAALGRVGLTDEDYARFVQAAETRRRADR